MRGRSSTFYVLDFDRCLGNVPALVEQLAMTIEQLGYVTRRELIQIRDTTEATGGSFDAVGYLRGSVGEEAVTQTLAAYKSMPVENNEVFCMPGARELLTWLDQNNFPYGILTYGGEDWQLAKITLAGLAHVPTLVTGNPHKGKFIASWYDASSDNYTLPGGYGSGNTTDEIVLVDDKASAFDGFDLPHARGYWVQGSGPLLTSQLGSVPSNVRTVQSLRDIVNYEQNILT